MKEKRSIGLPHDLSNLISGLSVSLWFNDRAIALSTMRAVLRLCFLASLLTADALAADPPRTGPATENRFPPLKVPEGFSATLFACDPLIEYPSAIALGPRLGTLFVAVDYMTGLGTEIIRRDEIRLMEDTDGDGYADAAKAYADGFNSIQGLTYHGGTVYAMHAPYLTALRDKDGDGKADERRDLATGLGLTPEQNPVRLHCANGLVMGHDGWLYLALGDHGCRVKRPEGDELVLEGGGILRCRPDGRDLHVFSSGLRNIYDVALDEELNVFVRDNENDGGDYKIRVCHSFFGADHGYPYLYYERPDEAMPPLADLGLGSSAGGLAYLEQQFPAEYRGNLFFCEWGRAVVRYSPRREGSGFNPLKEIEFAAGAANDPYGFKPTDLVVDYDGSLIVADWADGQRPKRGRARIYRIRHGERNSKQAATASDSQARTTQQWIAQLDSESYLARCQAQEELQRRGRDGVAALAKSMAKGEVTARGRLHAVWIIARAGGAKAIEELLALAKKDRDPRVQAQAVRAIGDLADPVLVSHRLDAGPGDASLAEQLASLAEGKDPLVLLEVIVALGRLQWPGAPAWLARSVKKFDPALAHAAQQMLRRARNWPAVLKLLDQPTMAPTRPLALRAVADRAFVEVADGLIERLGKEPDAARRREYVDLLARVYKKPGPWVYWGYRPAPRTPGSVAWERTEAIGGALNAALGDADRTVCHEALRRMQREKVPVELPPLAAWLREEGEPARVEAILTALRDHAPDRTRDLLAELIIDRRHSVANRLSAFSQLVAGLDEGSQEQLLSIARALEEGEVLAEALRQLAQRPRLKSGELLVAKLQSSDAAVRRAAVAAVGSLRVAEAAEPVRLLLSDSDAGVRLAAARAAGELKVAAAADTLLAAMSDGNPRDARGRAGFAAALVGSASLATGCQSIG